MGEINFKMAETDPAEFVTCDQLPAPTEQNLPQQTGGENEEATLEENQDEAVKPEDVEISSVKDADFAPAKESRYSKFTKEQIDDKPKEKTIGGRSVKSWAGLLSFYLVFYITLFVIFFSFLKIVYNNTPENHPYLTGRGLQSPGLSFVPNLDINTYQDHIFSRLHAVNTEAAAVFKNDGEEHRKYVAAIQQYFKEQNVTDTAQFGECGSAPYGWDAGTPCYFFKLNKIYSWAPQGLHGADVLSYFDGARDAKILGAPDQSFCADKSDFCVGYGKNRLSQMLSGLALDQPQTKNKIPVRCMHYSDTGEVPVDHFPADGFLNWNGPFKGKESAYASALTAVRFNLTASPNKAHRFYCFAFDRNVELEYKQENSGVTSFFLKYES